MSSEDTKPGSSKLQQVSPAPTRARVWRACLVCRKRKVKCNGQEPCAYCISSGKVCSFNDTSDNGANARQHANTVDDRLARVEDTIQRFMPMYNTWAKENNMPSQESIMSAAGRTLSSAPTGSTSDRPRVPYRPSSAIQKLMLPAPDPAFTIQSPTLNSEPGDESSTKWSHKSSHLTKDSYGNLRYTGGTSSYMLVDALTSIQDQTTDASPESVPSGKTSTDEHLVLPFFTPNKQFQTQEALPNPEDMPYPTAEMADELVALYFSEIHYTFPILHTQSFVGRYKNAMEARHSVFACGACLRSRNRPSQNPEAGQEYWGIEFYQTAQLLFWRGSGASRLEHVQALSLLAICNASWNTLAQSWLNAGQALRRAQDIGLHRVARRTSLGEFEREMRIRVWWCVYGLDRVLSIALGRPSGAFDDDCDVDFPAELDDAQLIQNYDMKAARGTKCYMTGFVALLRIYVIAGRIMRFVSSSRVDDPKSPGAKHELDDLDQQLKNWLEQLPMDMRHTTGNAPNRDPHMVSLSLITYFVYYSCVINLHRPFIPEYTHGSADLTSLGQCVRAARSCIEIGEQTETTLPTSHHLAFAVQYITLSGVLLLRCIGYVNQPELFSAILGDSERCVRILQGLQQIWPASKRCREIVADLLGIVKMKLAGDPMGSPPMAQQRISEPMENPGRHTSPRAKRKRSSDHDRSLSGSRPRIEEDGSQYHWPEGHGRGNGGHLHGGSDGSFGYGEGSHHERSRMSNLRSSASDHDSAHSSTSMAPPGMPSLLYPSPYSQHDGNSPLTPNAPLNVIPPGSRHQPMPNMNFSTEGLPFSGYNFLGEDLHAVVGMHPQFTTAEPTSQVYADNAQVLWEAYNGHQNIPFSENHHPHHHQRN